MGDMGLQLVEQLLPKLRTELQVDLVVAQAENVSEGKGITLTDFERLKRAGVDFCSGGNWSAHREEITPALDDPDQPIIRPANYPEGTPGQGFKYVETGQGKVLVVSLLGHIVGKDASRPVDNPLQIIDQILESQADTKKVATVVNFHGDYSSEKVVIGHYLDGRVTLVVGDHWHVQTADAQVLPGGTAHITDVGMCGSLDSSLGVTLESIIPRWRDGRKTRNILATTGRQQFNAVLVDNDSRTGLAKSVRTIRQVIA
jgi:hypothetical protein